MPGTMHFHTSTVCQKCGSELAPPATICYCKICDRAFCQKCEKSNGPSKLIGEDVDWCCKSCSEKREALRHDNSTYATPLPSPTFYQSSYGSCNSNYDDSPGDTNRKIRGNGAEDLGTEQKHSNAGLTEHSGKHESGSLTGGSGILYSIATAMDDISQSTSVALENLRDGDDTSIKVQNGTSGDFQSERAGDDSDGRQNAIDNTRSFLTNIDTNPLIWIPPEPEYMEDEMESVANNDDDDYNTDGTKWGQPSSLNCLSEDGKFHGYKEEHKKAMGGTMNRQLRILASKFLTMEGISVCDGDDAENWLNIVASLSWEALQLIKPDASEGRAMDPGSYVKVKCIASGARSQSKVINGLVFKKNTAHKHMPTKFKNPRLLLVKGTLGNSAVSFSSLRSMEEEKDYLKSITDMTESSHINLVLVEKSVSRDIQESLLAKGITLVYDMKLPRLRRIAQCTGSQIISSDDILMWQNLKQCDSFHTEKFAEEHNNSVESRKKSPPTKTLMFLEGCPKPLGCTVLLKGAHSDELKKVKHAMQCTVFEAHHLVLETSFFEDQRALYTDISAPSYPLDKQLLDENLGAEPNSVPEKSVKEVTQFDYDPDAEGSLVVPLLHSDSDSAGGNILVDSQFHDEPNNYGTSRLDAPVQLLLPGQRLLSSVSASLERFLGDSFLPLTSESISSYFNFRQKFLNDRVNDIPVSVSLDTLDHPKEGNGINKLEKADDETYSDEKAVVVSDITENIEQHGDGASNEVQIHAKNDTERMQQHDDGNEVRIQCKDDIESVQQHDDGAGNKLLIQSKDYMLDSQSILVLFSSQCFTKQIICEKSHLFRIKYYGNNDMSLGRLLQEILLNQKHSCPLCGEPPESHLYSYTHQNGNLTVLVKRLPQESILRGEAEKKIWMWTRCLKCVRGSGIPKSTQRVLMSSEARGLSFGKFLELSLSGHSATSRRSRCGHSLLRDSLQFFGLGSNVAMFRYSPLEIYTVYKSPPVMEFNSPNGHEWLKREANDVLVKGKLVFMEAANMLQKLKPAYASSCLTKSMTMPGSVKKFSDVEDMLMQEKIDFERSLLNAISQCGKPGKTLHENLDLRWLKQELLLELVIWDRRLHSILLCTKGSDTYVDEISEERSPGENCVVPDNKLVEGNMAENSGIMMEDRNQIPIDPLESSSTDIQQSQDHAISENELEIKSFEISGNTCNRNPDSFDIVISDTGLLSRDNSSPFMTEDHPTQTPEQYRHTGTLDHSSVSSNKDSEKRSFPSLDHMKASLAVPATKETLRFAEERADSELRDDAEPCIWAPFSELRDACKKDIRGGSLQMFEFITSYTPTYLSPMRQPMAQEINSLHFLVGPSGNIVSFSEDDISSIIACALALTEDWYCSPENSIEGERKSETDKRIDNSLSLTSDSSYWPSTGSSEPQGMRSSQSLSSLSSDELSNSGSDGPSFVDRSRASDLHPEIHVRSAKVPGKGKCSVVCRYAKQFCALRRRCCPSEIAYISSLRHCRKWDAQGGKSKAFFAKSMDDRFIIKQLQKTELDSFLKFAPDYFKHISDSLDSGSQTCLAKILGIYQVRQNKGGKEVKTDLMVMENILFGRNFSRIYDLKGADSRYVVGSDDPECVLWDENFAEDMRVSPIYIDGKSKHLMQRAIWNDTSFLNSINVMDYSLLLGVDKQRHELVFGIIDYVRQYTWDKQLETVVKTSLVVAKNSLPTVVPPKEYKKRFRKFMAKYFLTVPDSWSSERCAGLCEFCIGDSC